LLGQKPTDQEIEQMMGLEADEEGELQFHTVWCCLVMLCLVFIVVVILLSSFCRLLLLLAFSF
jgi:hypothetical protein